MYARISPLMSYTPSHTFAARDTEINIIMTLTYPDYL